MWWYVYVIKSVKTDRIYIGSTNDLKRRVYQHNNNGNISTKRDAPWKLETCIAVKTKEKARELEKYIKSGSGRAMIKKRLLVS